MSEAKKWHGIDRSLVTWYPSIDSTKCDSCGWCILTCGNDVYRWSTSEGKPIVANPGKCVIGCTSCGKLCPEEAISFPEDPKKFVKDVITKYKIFPAVKDDLKVRLEKFPSHALHSMEVTQNGR